MNLRRKTVLTMTVTPIIMILVMYVGAQFILLARAKKTSITQTKS
jgi:hypothetical protein